MAGDWLKVEKATPDKPEIAILARLLGVSHGEAFLEWFRAYSWADSICASGLVPDLSLDDGDKLSRCRPGTFAALANKSVQWVQEVDGGLQFKNWDRHNGKSAKTRAYESEKKRRQRSRPQECPENVPESSGQEGGPEKRREEKSKKKPLYPLSIIEQLKWPTALDNPECRSAIERWMLHKREQGKAYKGTSGPQAILNKTSDLAHPKEALLWAVEQAIASNYAGVFPESYQNNAKGDKKPSNDPRARIPTDEDLANWSPYGKYD